MIQILESGLLKRQRGFDNNDNPDTIFHDMDYWVLCGESDHCGIYRRVTIDWRAFVKDMRHKAEKHRAWMAQRK